MQHPSDGCPKAMTYGPCGGVTPALTCEVDERPCPFARLAAPVRWSGSEPDRGATTFRSTFVADVRTGQRDLAAGYEELVERDVVCLVGEHLDDDDGLDPLERADRLHELGTRAVITVAGRGRDARCVGELIERIAAVPAVVGVHCVTGDHPSTDAGPTSSGTPRTDGEFGVESFEMVAEARRRTAEHPIAVSVAASPASPPVDLRPRRLAEKQRAGATMAMLNHAGTVDHLIEFADACRASGVDIPLVAPVPVVVDVGAARRLQAFPGVRLPPELPAALESSDDPEAAGIEAAATTAAELFASGRFAAVDLSGGRRDDPAGRLRSFARVIDLTQERLASLNSEVRP